MTRWSWIILGVLVMALGIYAFRPATVEASTGTFLTVQAGTRYTLKAGGLTQVVDGERVVINGLDRPLNPEMAQSLWGNLANLRVEPTRIVTGVSADQLAAYGLASAADLTGSTALGPVHVRWGRSGAESYVWDGLSARLAAVPSAVVETLDRAAGRLDQRAALTFPEPPTRLVIEDLTLVANGAEWISELVAQRPSFTRRVGTLLQLLGQVELTDLAAPPVRLAPVVARITIGRDLTTHTVVIHQVGEDLQIAIDQLPPQRIADPAAWRTATQSFRHDVLMDVTQAMGGQDQIVAVRMTRSGKSILALVRGEQYARSEQHRWEVVWPGGREPAAPDALSRLLTVLDDLRIRDPVAGASDPGDSQGLVITVVGERGNHQVRLAVEDDDTVRSTHHRGQLLEPRRLREALEPPALLDPRLSNRNPQRIAKIQRRQPAEQRAEVVTRADGGTWRRTYPAPAVPVDGGAVDRLIRVLASAKAETIRLAQSPEDHQRAQAILAAPEAELAIRFAPAEMGQAANDETDLDETAAQDWGLAMVKDGSRWLATDAEGGLLLVLDAETVEALLVPLEGGRLFPIVPSTVTALEGTGPAGSWRIERAATGWSLTGDTSARVDPFAVRRLLRQLATLPGTPDARHPESAAPIASLVVEVPAVGGGRERLRLVLGPDGRPWVGSDLPGSAFPRGGAPAIPVTTVPALADLRAAP